MQPLTNTIVIALEAAVAAPFASRQLADLGARVIKIERPGVGDFARGYDDKANGLASYFAWLNRSKESLTLDVKSAAGNAILAQLLAKADIFLHNLAPGAVDRLGFAPEQLAVDYPRLINCAISGYGSSGNFGVVTSFEYQLHPVSPIVNLVAAAYPIEKTVELLPRWRDYLAQAPAEFSGNCLFWTIPDVPDFPAAARNRGVAIILGVYSGDLNEGAAFIQPLRELEGVGEPLVDLSGQLPFTAVQSMFDWIHPEGEVHHYWKSLHLNELNAESIAIIAEEVQQRPAEWTAFDIWAMGGAVSQVPADAIAMGDRGAPYTIVFNTSWHDPAVGDACIAWTRNFYARMQPYSPGSSYLNFPGFLEEERLVEKAYGRGYARLAAMKANYDLTNLFRLNQNIKPLAQGASGL